MRATWTRWTVGIAVTAVCALALGVAAGAQATDPMVGTWMLDVAKSTYKPGPAPKSATVVIDAAGKGIKVAIDAVGADGSPMKWGFTSQRDGKDVPVTGHPNYDMAAATQTSPTAGSTVYKKDGKPVATVALEVSKDGKTLTAKTTGTTPKGEAMNNVAVYTKQ